jgi:hypothetical protein
MVLNFVTKTPKYTTRAQKYMEHFSFNLVTKFNVRYGIELCY